MSGRKTEGGIAAMIVGKDGHRRHSASQHFNHSTHLRHTAGVAHGSRDAAFLGKSSRRYDPRDCEERNQYQLVAHVFNPPFGVWGIYLRAPQPKPGCCALAFGSRGIALTKSSPV